MKLIITLFCILGLSMSINFAESKNLKYYHQFVDQQLDSAAGKNMEKELQATLQEATKALQEAVAKAKGLVNQHMPKENEHKPVETPLSFGARQNLRDAAHKLREQVRNVKHDNHEDNVKEETHIEQLEAARDNYIADHQGGNVALKDEQDQVKGQINHDEEYRQKYENKEEENDKKAEEATDKEDKNRFIKQGNFDKERMEYFAKEANKNFQQLANFASTELSNDANLDGTVVKMDENIHNAEVTAFKVREEGDNKLKPLMEKLQEMVHRLHEGIVSNAVGVNDRNLEKTKKAIIEAGEAAAKVAKEESK